MTPAARIKAVLELLNAIDSSRIPMDGTVGDYMRGRRYIGGKDRANVAERVYNIARARARLGWWLMHVGVEDAPRHRLIAWLCLGEGQNARAVESLFDGSKYGPEALSEEEQVLAGRLKNHTLDHPDMPGDMRAECPAEWSASMHARFGGDFEKEMAAMIPPAALDLRVNLRKIAREDAIASLAKDHVKVTPTRWSPWGLRADGKVFLSKTKAFVKGLIEIQDEGSQLIALLCNAQPGAQVLDYCAGAGGKTLALASAMNNKGRIVACDIDANRLKKGRERFKRAGVADIVEVRPLTDEKNRKWLRRQKGTFAAVLVDAPCSGTGTWRRNPDLRWRHFGPSLEDLLKTQAELLDKVAKTVKPGGRLIYATCSLLHEENEAQVEAFLKREPDFEVLPIEQAWPEGEPPCAGPYMRLTPLRHETDGFFAAAMVRKAG
jgi:16S rRNA (cytosine967-C5)-methyltransferase